MKVKKIPRWLRDTLSVVGVMSILLIAYNLFMVKHPDWTLVPVQIVLALLAVGVWRFLSERSQRRRQLAAEKQAAVAKQRAEEERQAALQAVTDAQKRRQRNQRHQQPK